jgi:general secretion pathway protein K
VSKVRDRGFALLIVLWSLVLIGLLIAQLAASGRSAVRLAANLRAGATASAQADGAIYEAIYHSLSLGGDHWPADGSTHLLAGVTVRVESLAGKVNPNLASTAMLAGLMQACGAQPNAAMQLADAIIAWRSEAPTKQAAAALQETYQRAGMAYAPPAQPFADLSELADVLGMSPPLLACALPEMSLYQSGDPIPSQADATVRRALTLSGQSNVSGYSGSFPVVAIAVETASGVRRYAIVSLQGADAPVPFKLLAMADGAVP